MSKQNKWNYLTQESREAIIRGADRGISLAALAMQFNVHKSTISRTINNFRSRKTAATLPKSGRPKVTTENDDKLLIRMSKADPKKTAPILNSELKESYGVNCSVSTTKRRLNHGNLFGRRPMKKPLVSLKNRKARVAFAKKHLNWTSQQWAKVLFSDESKFMMFGSDGIQYVRRPKGTRNDPKFQLPTVKHGGGNIMVWGCFSRDGVGPLHLIEETMDRFVYRDILKDVMLPHAKDKMCRGWIFQQDNDPKHASNLLKEFFKTKKIRVLEWPSQSPDLNPIEHAWEHLGRQMHGKTPSNKKVLFEMLKEEWNKIPLNVVIKLIDSMPKRCQAVIDSKGYPTKY